jgi:serine protease Do
VITNNHVVDGADEIALTLHDGRDFKADVVGTDPRSDLALISFKTSEDVPIAVLGDSDGLMVGDYVFAVGNPLGFDATVTSGIVSALGRKAANGQSSTEYIQTDAAINQGNSGGALVNLYGEVVGINSWIASNSGGSIGLGFSIPVNTVKSAINDFVESGSVQYGWLGITVGTLTDQTKQEMGYTGLDGGFVYNVVNGSPADKAGILPGDFITQIGDKAVSDANELTMVVGNLKTGETQKFSFERLGQAMSLEVTIGLRDEAKVSAGLDVWPGMTVVTLNDTMRQQAGLPKDAGNIVVGSVDQNSPAEIAGIRGGDIIKSIDGTALSNIRDFYSTLNASKKDRIDFAIYRRGTEITIGLTRS